MTATTLVNAQLLSVGLAQLKKTTLQAGATSAALFAQVTTSKPLNNSAGQTSKLRLRYVVLPDVGTFDAAAVAQIASAAQDYLELSLDQAVGGIKWSKVGLFPIDAEVLYTWFDGSSFDDEALTVSLFLKEYP